jgi:hypothetical protein
MGGTSGNIAEERKSGGVDPEKAQSPMPIFARQKVSEDPFSNYWSQDSDFAKLNTLNQPGNNNEREKYCH